MENKNLITVSCTPHMRSKITVNKIMLDVIISLVPAAIMGIYFFGFGAIKVILLSVISAVFFEYVFQKATKRDVTINDLSAVVTGLLLAYNLPSTAPFWMPIVGSFVAIILAKQLFGGIGQNFINPALAGRAFLLASYPAEMTNWVAPGWGVDAVTTPTPLAALKQGVDLVSASGNVISATPGKEDIINALTGNIGGCIGETCAIALLIGGLYLIYKKVINIKMPLIYIVTVFILTGILGRETGRFPLYEILTGGVMLGAFFMITDYTTSPMTPKGQIIFALGCGIITSLIRIYGSYPEGVSYSILIMNLFVPIIDRYTKPVIIGEARK